MPLLPTLRLCEKVEWIISSLERVILLEVTILFVEIFVHCNMRLQYHPLQIACSAKYKSKIATLKI